MAKIATTEVITAALNGRSVLLSDKLSSDYTTMTADQILNGTGVAAMVSDIKDNTAFGDGATATTGGAIGNGATATTGGAVGTGASATTTGFAGGEQASATSGGAVGYKATSSGNGGAIGNKATAYTGGAAGYTSETGAGGAIGQGAKSVGGAAVGWGASTSDGAALGKNAKCESGNTKINAIQLGTGTNSTAGTMQVYSTPLLISDGNGGLVIPPALLIASVGAMTAQEKTDFKTALGIS